MSGGFDLDSVRLKALSDETEELDEALQNTSPREASPNDAARDVPEQVEYRDSRTLDPEIDSTKSGSDTTVTQAPPRRKYSVSGTTYIRDFPKSLARFVRDEIPRANNNTDALAAYVYARAGINAEVPDDVKNLAKNWADESSSLEANVAALDARVNNLVTQTKELIALNNELLLAIGFLAYDRLGYRKDMPSAPKNVRFDEPGVSDIIAALKLQSNAMREAEIRRKGRRFE